MTKTLLAARLAQPSTPSASDVWSTAMSATTMVATMRGEVRAIDLRAGDTVFTRDNGPLEISAIRAEAGETGTAKAVSIRKGALGHGLPERDLVVAAESRVLMSSDKMQLLFDTEEAFVVAGDLVGREGITYCAAPTTWVGLALASHEVILANGIWAESEPARLAGGQAIPANRRVLKRFEAQLI